MANFLFFSENHKLLIKIVYRMKHHKRAGNRKKESKTLEDFFEIFSLQFQLFLRTFYYCYIPNNCPSIKVY